MMFRHFNKDKMGRLAQHLQVVPVHPRLQPAHGQGAEAEVQDHPQCPGSKQVMGGLSLMHVTDPDLYQGQWSGFSALTKTCHFNCLLCMVKTGSSL
jgi:hypothetical protein